MCKSILFAHSHDESTYSLLLVLGLFGSMGDRVKFNQHQAVKKPPAVASWVRVFFSLFNLILRRMGKTWITVRYRLVGVDTTKKPGFNLQNVDIPPPPPSHLSSSPFFSLPPSRNSDPGSYSRLFSPPYPVRFVPCIFIARIFQLFPRRLASNCAYPR